MPWLKYTLRMLKLQSIQDFELICVDSGSSDGSWDILEQFAPDVLYRIPAQDYVPGKVLNQAIQHCKGEYIVFNNADCIPLDSLWLQNLIAPLENDPKLVAVFANQIARADANPLVAKDYERAFGDGSVSGKWRHFFSLASSAARKDILLKHPFNEKLQYSEDIEWSWRMKGLGYTVQYTPEAKVEHSHNYTLAQIKKRYFGEGKAEAFIYRDYYQNQPRDLSFLPAVIMAALAEFLRDIPYLMRNKRLDWIPKAKIYRFAQRYYAYRGRIAGLRLLSQVSHPNLMVSCMAFDNGKSGIADYTVNVVRELLKFCPVTLLIHPSDKAIFPLQEDKLKYELVAEWLKRPLFSMIWHLYCLPTLIRKRKWDMVLLPAGNRRLLAKYPAATVVTFHDLSQFHIPGKYDFLRMLYIKKVVPFYLKKAPKIFAISQSTKADMLRFYRMKPEEIEVNYNGYNAGKVEQAIEAAQMREKFGIKGKYLLYIARIEHPGKNHLGLLKAYQALPRHIMNEYELVLGGGEWNNAEIVMDYHAKMPQKQRIHFLGYVDNGDIVALYQNASLYVFPSLYEGFGLPMLEAFAAGVPVICSNNSSLPEIGAEAVRLFDASDPQSIADCIENVLCNAPLQLQMIFWGKERLKSFSWEQHAKRIFESLEAQSSGS